MKDCQQSTEGISKEKGQLQQNAAVWRAPAQGSRQPTHGNVFQESLIHQHQHVLSNTQPFMLIKALPIFIFKRLGVFCWEELLSSSMFLFWEGVDVLPGFWGEEVILSIASFFCLINYFVVQEEVLSFPNVLPGPKRLENHQHHH